MALAFTIWMIAFGAVAARSPEWERALQDAARREADRRGLLSPPLTNDDNESLMLLVGGGQIESDPKTDERFVEALVGLTDADGDQISALMNCREELLVRSVEKQPQLVRNIVSHKWAARAWGARKFLSSIVVAGYGLRWFLPLFFRKTRGIGEKCLATATLLGVWTGLLWWGAVRISGLNGPDDWITFVGALITSSTVFGFMVAIVSQLHGMLSRIYGPVRNWKARYPTFALAFIAIWAALVFLVFSGKLQQWSASMAGIALNWVEGSDLSNLVAMALPILFLVFLVRNGVRLAKSPMIILHDRLETMIVTVVLCSLLFLMVLFIFDVPENFAAIAVWSVGLLFIIAVFAVGAIKTAKFAMRYRCLRRAGVAIPKKGFRLWILAVWSLLLVAIPAIWGVLLQSPQHLTGLIGLSIEILLFLVSAVHMLLFLPGIVITILYIYRIRHLHQKLTAFPGEHR